MRKLQKTLLPLLLAVLLCFTGCNGTTADADNTLSPPSQTTTTSTEEPTPQEETQPAPETAPSIDLGSIPAFSGEPYVAINNNIPDFTDADLTTSSFEEYSSLDSLGRCGVAYACIGTDLMPTEDRGSIGQVKPSGWHTVKYDCVDGKYLYNRCHLIGYQLTAENANENNLITGTRYLNVEGMLPFENMVADYIKETGNHVLYRVTPIFEGNNLVASGVHMEAKSVEDHGEGILFNVYCYNAQPGVGIDYATGESWLDSGSGAETPSISRSSSVESGEVTYILNTNSHKFHDPSCSSVDQMNDSNKEEFTGTRDEVIAMGYEPCGRCNP
nr:MAG TPA: DNA/RNA non-specific endonuclease [Caudoviricetes sp.]